jgi:hypothetical protein
MYPFARFSADGHEIVPAILMMREGLWIEASDWNSLISAF